MDTGLTTEELLQKTLITARMFWRGHYHLLRGRIEFEDLLQVARLAALQARARYRKGGTAKEWTFLQYRVHGAMLDLLDWDKWIPTSRHGLHATMVELTARHTIQHHRNYDPIQRRWLEYLLDKHCTQREASAIRNHYLYDIEQKEIARWWNRHPTDVFYHIKRGLAKLRKVFTNDRRID
jgi:RNA polymerase sigma factor (sigma-70 family)